METALKKAEGRAAATLQEGKELNASDVAEMLLQQADLQNEEIEVSPACPPIWPVTVKQAPHLGGRAVEQQLPKSQRALELA